MFGWLLENVATIIIVAVLLAVVAAIIVGLVRDRRRGKSACGCGCANCPMSRACHQKK